MGDLNYGGAATGAAAGATAGAAFGPWGAAAGGLIGGGIGLFTGGGGDEFRQIDRNDYNLPGYQQGYDQRGQLAGQYANQGSSFRGDQSGLLARLQQQSMGQGPSQANMQMQSGLQASLAQQQALAASGRGNAAMASRQASMQQGNIASQLSGQAALARVQEMQNAQGLYGQMLGQARGQDIQQTGLNNQSQLEALRQQAQLQSLQQQGTMNYQAARAGHFNTLAGLPTQTDKFQSGLASALAMYGSMQKKPAGTQAGTPETINPDGGDGTVWA